MYGIHSKSEVNKPSKYNLSTGKSNVKQLKIISPSKYISKELTYFENENEYFLLKKNTSNSYSFSLTELYKSKNDPFESDFIYINKQNMKEEKINTEFNTLLNDNLRNNPLYMANLYMEAQLKHPRKIVNGQYYKHSFLSYTGFFCCCGRACSRKFGKSEFEPMGVGVVSYFKILKILIIFFSIMSVLTIGLGNKFAKFSSEFHQDSWLYKSTLANTVNSIFNFVVLDREILEKSGKKDLVLDCTIDENGNTYNDTKKIGKPYTVLFTEPKLTSETGISYMYNLSDISERYEKYPFLFYKYKYEYKDEKSYNENLTYNGLLSLIMARLSPCYSLSRCINSDLIEVLPPLNVTPKTASIAIVYECYSPSNQPQDLKDGELRASVVYVETCILFLIFAMYLVIKIGVKVEDYENKNNKVFVQNFTLMISNFKCNSTNLLLEYENLVNYLNDIYNKYNKFKDNSKEDFIICDINVPDVSDEKMEAMEKIKEHFSEIIDINSDKYGIKGKFKGIFNDTMDFFKNFKENNNKMIEMTDRELSRNFSNRVDTVNDLNENLFDEGSINLSSSSNNDKKLKKINKRENAISEEIYDFLNNPDNQIYSNYKINPKKLILKEIYVTFRSYEIAKFFYDEFDVSFCSRLYYTLTCQKKKIAHLYYNGQFVTFNLTNDEPSNIKWENLMKSNTRKYCGRFLSIFLTFIFIVVSAVVFFILNDLQIQADEKYEYGDENFINSILVSVVINIIGVVGNVIITKLTDMENHIKLSSNISSNIWKNVIFNFITLALTFMFAKIKDRLIYKNTSDFYYFIIVNMLSSMIFSIGTSHAVYAGFLVLNLVNRYKDSKYSNGKYTKCSSKDEYMETYIGDNFDMEERYGTILTQLLLTLIYGNVAPLMYIFFTIFLVSVFIFDKLMIIHYYKKPPRYDIHSAKIFINILTYIIFLHMIFFIYLVGNPYFFNYSQDNAFLSGEYSKYSNRFSINIFKLKDDVVSDDTKFNYTLYLYNGQIFIIIFFLIFVYIATSFIVDNVIVRIAHKCKQCMDKFNNTVPNLGYGAVLPFDKLKDYLEYKKLEIFTIIKNIDNENSYNNLIYNNLRVIQYLIKYLKERTENEKLGLGNEGKIIQNDISYNIAFIDDYKIYRYFTMLNM